MEREIANNSGQLIVAEGDGEVVKADGAEIQVKYKDSVKTYLPLHFKRSNDGESINQRVTVDFGFLFTQCFVVIVCLCMCVG